MVWVGCMVRMSTICSVVGGVRWVGAVVRMGWDVGGLGWRQGGIGMIDTG
jgi:hypothetical protein